MHFSRFHSRVFILVSSGVALLSLSACHRSYFPDYPADYREYAYVTNGASNTVSVLDLVYLRQDRVLQVGRRPTGITANPKRNEIYVVNTDSGTVTVIDAAKNTVEATIGVHSQPFSISVSPDGRRGYVANSGANTVSVIDLDRRREIAVAGTGEGPGEAIIAPDMRSLVVSNRRSGSVSVYDVAPVDPDNVGARSLFPLRLRTSFDRCPGATDIAVLPDSSKAFIACSDAHYVLAVGLAAAPGSWAAKQDASLLTDRRLALLDVGKTPVHLAMKPDGGEIFVSNFGSDSISEIATGANEVGGTYMIGTKPVHGVVSADNSTLWVSNFGADSVCVYSIDDGKRVGSVRTGSAPDALAFSADEHLLLVLDSKSGDIAALRTQGSNGPELFTMLPAGQSPNAIVIKKIQKD